MKPDFRERSRQSELMDDLSIGYAEFDECLRHLAVVNAWTLAYPPTLCWLGARLTRHPGASVLDIGSGGGDMLRRIARWAKRRGIMAALTGIDINPWAKRSAEAATPPGLGIAQETCDIFAFDPERRADYIISSLFTHHLDDAQLPRFLQWMERHATRGWFINDLHRHPLPHWFIGRALAFGQINRLVRHDAPVSVARAFTKADWRRALAQAGIPADDVRIRWHFPFRWGVGRDKR